MQILPVSQIQPTAHQRPTPSAHSGAPFTKVGHQVPCCWCNPLTLVTTPFLRPAAALSCSHLMNRETMFHGSHICGYMEGSWQGPNVLDSLTIGALYHPLSCGPRAAGNPGKFSAAPPCAPSESGPSVRPAGLCRRRCKSSWPGPSLCPQDSQDTHKNVACTSSPIALS